MRTLWRDLREHRVAAVLLLVWWIAQLAADIYWYSLYTAPNRTPPVENYLDSLRLFYVSSFFAFLVAAAILAGWWRATALKSGSWVGPSILSGLLAALTCSMAFDLFELGFYSIGPLIAAGDWLARAPSGGYTVIDVFWIDGLIAAVLGALGGIVGGWAARAYWRARGSRRDRTPA